MPTLRITDTATRNDIAAAIAALRAKAKRLPAHWVETQAEIADDVDQLVEAWVRAEG